MPISAYISRLSARVYVTLSLALTLTAAHPAATAREVVRDSVEVKFRQGKTALDPKYKGNGARLDSLITTLETERGRRGIVRLKVTGGASPEGSVELNRRLSEKRASNIFDYIDRRIELPDTLATYTYLGRDWKGLRDMVEADENTPGREDVLRLLDEIITAVENGADQRDFLGRLMRSGNGMGA